VGEVIFWSLLQLVAGEYGLWKEHNTLCAYICVSILINSDLSSFAPLVRECWNYEAIPKKDIGMLCSFS
jgi:hypothetical protein